MRHATPVSFSGPMTQERHNLIRTACHEAEPADAGRMPLLRSRAWTRA
jgi:hypothetical protein